MVTRYTKSPVGAHHGTGEWLLQRLTAVVMAVYTAGLAACLLWYAPASHLQWKAIFAGPVMRVATMVFFAALLYHAWVGMRDIIMDYARATSVRLLLQAAVGFALLGYLVWSAAILWGR